MNTPFVGAASLAVAIVLLSAGLTKVSKSSGFAEQIADYGILPYGASKIAARLIPTAELAAAGLLAIGLIGPAPAREVGGLIAVGLFAVFLLALASAQLRGREIACACFGGDGELETIGTHSLVRTGLLLVLAVMASIPGRSGGVADVVALAVALGALIMVLSEVARVYGPLRASTSNIVAELVAVSNDVASGAITIVHNRGGSP